MLDYMVLYQSETGNTKKLATSIFAALPGMAKDLRSIDELSSAGGFHLFYWFLCSPGYMQSGNRQSAFYYFW